MRGRLRIKSITSRDQSKEDKGNDDITNGFY